MATQTHEEAPTTAQNHTERGKPCISQPEQIIKLVCSKHIVSSYTSMKQNLKSRRGVELEGGHIRISALQEEYNSWGFLSWSYPFLGTT